MTRPTTALPAGRAAGVPRRAVAIALATLLALVLAACGGTGATTSPEPSTGARAEGLVVDVVSSGPVAVSRFTVRTADGTVMEFDVGTLDVSAGGFPAEHLGEHRLAAEPVVVLYRDEGGRHVAFKLEDAEPAPS